MSARRPTKKELEEMLSRLSQEREELSSKVRELEADYARLKADFHNYRRRVEESRERERRLAARGLIEKLLPVLDNLDRALSFAGTDDPLCSGLRMVRAQMMAVLAEEGLKPIEALGSRFDPSLHEAVEVCEGEEDGLVVEEISRGYALGDVVLRPARVKVCRSRR